MFSTPSWRIEGVASEVRELKSKEGKKFADAVKIVAMGGTFEATTRDDAVSKSVGVGQAGVFSGTFEQFNGALRLVLGKVSASQAAAAPASAATK